MYSQCSSIALVILFLDNQIHSSFLIQSLLCVDLYLNEHTGSLRPEQVVNSSQTIEQQKTTSVNPLKCNPDVTV